MIGFPPEPLHQPSPPPVDLAPRPASSLGEFLRMRALFPFCTAIAFGAAAGVFRVDGGFLVGLQGMLVGGLIGWIGGLAARRDDYDGWPFGLRLSMAFALTLVFWVAQIVAADLTKGPFTPGAWLEAAIVDGETMFGTSRYTHETHVLRPGPVGWVGFNLLDMLLQTFLTLVTFGMGIGSLCTTCGRKLRHGKCKRCGPVPRPGQPPPTETGTVLLAIPLAMALAYGGVAYLIRADKTVDVPSKLLPPSNKPYDVEATRARINGTLRLMEEAEACDKLPDPAQRSRCRRNVLQRLDKLDVQDPDAPATGAPAAPAEPDEILAPPKESPPDEPQVPEEPSELDAPLLPPAR
jgi:hypothetical protein